MGQTNSEAENLQLTLRALEQALSLHLTCHEGFNITLETLLLLGRYLENLLFQKGNKAVADRVVICYQNALELDPGNPRALTGLVVVRYSQYQFLGNRWMLDEAIDLACECLNASSKTSMQFVVNLIFVFVSLEARADLDGYLDDLEVAIELLRLGTHLEINEGDYRSVVHSVLAELLAIRYDILERDQDMSEAQQLVHRVSREWQVSNRHSFHQNFAESQIYLIRFEKLRYGNDGIQSLQAFVKGWGSVMDNTAASASSIPLSFKSFADVFRLSNHYIGSQSLLLSRAYDLARLALIKGQMLCQSWDCQYMLHEFYTVLGKIQRSRISVIRRRACLTKPS